MGKIINIVAFAEQFLESRPDCASKIYRICKIAYPFLKAEVQLKKQLEHTEFNIIEKYMDRLIAGYTNTDTMENLSYISDKDTLIRTMGLDGPAYEVASSFYEDLKQNRHFEETAEGLKATDIGRKSVELDVKILAGDTNTKVYFDTFDMKICPKNALPPRIAMENMAYMHKKNAIFILPPNTVYAMDFAERQMQDAQYIDAKELELRGLPNGFQGVELTDFSRETDADIQYCFYYLIILKEFDDYSFMLYNPENGSEVHYIALADMEHSQARRAILDSCAINSKTNSVHMWLCPGFSILLKEKGEIQSDVVCTNYGYQIHFTLQQAKSFLLSENWEDTSFLACAKRIINRKITILDQVEPGAICTYVVDDASKALLEAVIEHPENRIELVNQFTV